MTAPNAVDVWRVDLKTAARRLAVFDGYLSNDERERAGRFRAYIDRTRWVTYRIALRIILGRYLGVVPSEVEYTLGRHGKPHLAPPAARFTFNGAHSGDVALVTVAPGFEVGIDVEMVCARAGLASVGHRFFSAREAAAIGALPGDAQLRAFYACWTRKEAVAKALGLGLRAPLDQIEVGVQPAAKMERLPIASATVTHRPMTMIDLSCGDAAGALAMCCSDPSIREVEAGRLFG